MLLYRITDSSGVTDGHYPGQQIDWTSHCFPLDIIYRRYSPAITLVLRIKGGGLSIVFVIFPSNDSQFNDTFQSIVIKLYHFDISDQVVGDTLSELIVRY